MLRRLGLHLDARPVLVDRGRHHDHLADDKHAPRKALPPGAEVEGARLERGVDIPGSFGIISGIVYYTFAREPIPRTIG